MTFPTLRLDQALQALSIVADWQMEKVFEEPLHMHYDYPLYTESGGSMPGSPPSLTCEFEPVPFDGSELGGAVHAVKMSAITVNLDQEKDSSDGSNGSGDTDSHSDGTDSVAENGGPVLSMAYTISNADIIRMPGWTLKENEQGYKWEYAGPQVFCPSNITIKTSYGNADSVHSSHFTAYYFVPSLEAYLEYHPWSNMPASHTEGGMLVMQQIFRDMHGLLYQRPIEYLALYSRDLVTV